MDSQHEHVRNTSDTSSDNNLTEVSVGSSTSLDLTNESIEKNQNATSNEKDGGTCSPSNNISSISRCERSEHAPKSDQNESTEQDLPPVGTKRKSNQRKLSHEERLQLNREAAKETRKRKKEELEELRRIIISNSRETQQFRRNNEVLVKENEDLKKQNLFLQEELLLLRTQSLIRGAPFPQSTPLPSANSIPPSNPLPGANSLPAGNTLPAVNALPATNTLPTVNAIQSINTLSPAAANFMLAGRSNESEISVQRQNLFNELVLIQRATNANAPLLNNDALLSQLPQNSRPGLQLDGPLNIPNNILFEYLSSIQRSEIPQQRHSSDSKDRKDFSPRDLTR